MLLPFTEEAPLSTAVRMGIAASLLFGFLTHAAPESSVSVKEFVHEKNTQTRERILSTAFEKTVDDIVKPLRSAIDSKGNQKSEDQLHRDRRRADRIEYARETYNAEKLANMISDAYVRNPYQPLDKILMTYLSIEVKAMEAAMNKK
jgi:hypothetical protein